MHQLSSKLKPFQYIVLGLCLIIVVSGIRYFRAIGNKEDWKYIIQSSIAISIGLLLIFLVRMLKTINFDETKLIISSKKNTEIVPFENILIVKMIMAEMAGVDFYKIVYTNSEGATKSVRFLPTDNFQVFIILLKEKNKDVEISNWATSFDL